MNREEILLEFSKLSLEEQDRVIEEMWTITRTLYWETYTHVEIFNKSGNISSTIKEETGFDCYWRSNKAGTGYIGTNVIVIPKEKYSEELEKELLIKYDNV